MNDLHDTPPDTAAATKILVWDAPLRLFHWLLAASFAGAWLTAESERWALMHLTLGYTMVGLVAFRLVWGFVGPRHARFAGFVRGPREALRYLFAMAGPRPPHHVGHNPAGGLAILALLALTALTTALGIATYSGLGGDWLGEAHEAAAGLMLAFVGLHLAGVALGSWRHRENLVRAMIDGRKPGPASESIRRRWRPVAVLLLAAVVGFWAWQWQTGGGDAAGVNLARQGHERHHDHDDD